MRKYRNFIKIVVVVFSITITIKNCNKKGNHRVAFYILKFLILCGMYDYLVERYAYIVFVEHIFEGGV